MLVSCAHHDVFVAQCAWCTKATKITRTVLWRRRWRNLKEIVSRLLK